MVCLCAAGPADPWFLDVLCLELDQRVERQEPVEAAAINRENEQKKVMVNTETGREVANRSNDPWISFISRAHWTIFKFYFENKWL